MLYCCKLILFAASYFVLSDCKVRKFCTTDYPALLKYNFTKQISQKVILYKSTECIIPPHIHSLKIFKLRFWLQNGRFITLFSNTCLGDLAFLSLYFIPDEGASWFLINPERLTHFMTNVQRVPQI